MTRSNQTGTSLRDEILRVVQPHIGPRHSEIEIAVAIMGACAVVCALLPPEPRRTLIEVLTEALPIHAEKRAQEIMSGAFDDEMDRRVN